MLLVVASRVKARPGLLKVTLAVATTARRLRVPGRDYTADVLVVDEAWQMTYADLGGLGPLSAQVVLVGDPGQIRQGAEQRAGGLLDLGQELRVFADGETNRDVR